MQLENRVVVVTGGASGLGRATVEAFLARGARAGIFDVNEAAGTALARGLGAKAIYAPVDVADEASVAAGIAAVMRAFNRIDVCVNCAGIPNPGKTFGRKGPLPLKNFARVIEVNLNGTFNVIRLAVAEMVKHEPAANGERGAIINTASGAAWDGQMGQAAYAASKAGLIGMNLPIARDLAEYGIRVNTIAPGLFDTGMSATLPPDIKQGIVKYIEFPKRIGDPAEFGALAVHLAENPYINASTIRIDAAGRMPAR